MTRLEPTGEFNGIRSQIVRHEIRDIPGNALFLTLPEPRQILSSREGLKTVSAICNCYLPKETWPLFDDDPANWDSYLGELLEIAGFALEDTAVLSTGVSMEYLAHHEEVFQDRRVQAFVTAGVHTNAMRIGVDRAAYLERDGVFEKVGTINTIVFTSVDLDVSGMAASFITVTEAKNIALQELDIRSVYDPEHAATGTGTDQIIIVPGHDGFNRYVGGHTKMGEMIARSVTAATIEGIRNTFPS